MGIFAKSLREEEIDFVRMTSKHDKSMHKFLLIDCWAVVFNFFLWLQGSLFMNSLLFS